MKVGDRVIIKKSDFKWLKDGEEVIINHIWSDKEITVRKLDNSWRVRILVCNIEEEEE